MSSLDSSSQNVAHSTPWTCDHRKHSDHDWSGSHRKDRGTICLPVVKMRVFEPDQQDIFIVCNICGGFHILPLLKSVGLCKG